MVALGSIKASIVERWGSQLERPCRTPSQKSKASRITTGTIGLMGLWMIMASLSLTSSLWISNSCGCSPSISPPHKFCIKGTAKSSTQLLMTTTKSILRELGPAVRFLSQPPRCQFSNWRKNLHRNLPQSFGSFWRADRLKHHLKGPQNESFGKLNWCLNRL